MADRIEKFALVAAAGSSGLFQDHAWLDGTITRVELYVPAGHAGLTSWSFYNASTQMVPRTAGAVIVADDERFAWEIDNIPTGGTGYRSRYSNSDVYPHTFHISVWLTELEAGDPEPDLPVLVLPFVGVA